MTGRADVCGRAIAGMRCALSDGTALATEVVGPSWSDDSGWTSARYWSTVRLADVDGDGRADLCARTSKSWRCHLSTGDGFGDAVTGPAWSDESGWDSESWYATIRLGDLDGDGDLDLCGRTIDGVRCHTWDGGGFSVDAIVGPELSDANNWDEPQHYRTIRLADVDGDGRADLCARAGVGVLCWLSDGSGFPTQVEGPAFSDESGWNDPSQYATLRIGGTRRLGETPTTPGAGPDAPDGDRPGRPDAPHDRSAAPLEGSCSIGAAPRPALLWLVASAFATAGSVMRRRRARVP